MTNAWFSMARARGSTCQWSFPLSAVEAAGTARTRAPRAVVAISASAQISKVLGQADQSDARVGGAPHQAAGDAEVALDVVRRGHLHGGHPDAGRVGTAIGIPRAIGHGIRTVARGGQQGRTDELSPPRKKYLVVTRG